MKNFETYTILLRLPLENERRLPQELQHRFEQREDWNGILCSMGTLGEFNSIERLREGMDVYKQILSRCLSHDDYIMLPIGLNENEQACVIGEGIHGDEAIEIEWSKK